MDDYIATVIMEVVKVVETQRATRRTRNHVQYSSVFYSRRWLKTRAKINFSHKQVSSWRTQMIIYSTKTTG